MHSLFLFSLMARKSISSLSNIKNSGLPPHKSKYNPIEDTEQSQDNDINPTTNNLIIRKISIMNLCFITVQNTYMIT